LVHFVLHPFKDLGTKVANFFVMAKHCFVFLYRVLLRACIKSPQAIRNLGIREMGRAFRLTLVD
jgi:hypothetical protein